MPNSPTVSVIIVTFQRTTELLRAIESLLSSSYPLLEIIIVNNGPVYSEEFIQELKHKSSILSFIQNEHNVGAAEGRNVGYRVAKGDYMLFGDDDAFFDPRMVSELLAVFKSNEHIGIVQPIIFDTQDLQTIVAVGHGFNLDTARLFANDVGTKNIDKYTTPIPIPMAGCIWMVRRTVFAKIGEYDTDLFIPYEDTDFCLRAARAGFEIFLAPQAIAYHPLTKKTNLPKQILYLGITTPERAYRVMRNKIIFMRKHASRRQLLKFYFFLFPLYLFIHTFFILRAFRFDILKLYYHGTVDGLLYKKNYAK